MVSVRLTLTHVGVLLIAISKVYTDGFNTENMTSEILKLRSQIRSYVNDIEQEKRMNKNLQYLLKGLSVILKYLVSDIEKTKSLQQTLSSQILHLGSEVNATRCSLSTRLIDIENQITNLTSPSLMSSTETNYPSAQENRIHNPRSASLTSFSEKEPNFLPEYRSIELTDENFFLTPQKDYSDARMYCYLHDGEPFVPKTEEGFRFIVQKTTRLYSFGWIPLSDISFEGNALWDDSTAFKVGPFKPSFIDNDENNGNTEEKDCVDVNLEGVADWYSCSSSRHMLCVKRL